MTQGFEAQFAFQYADGPPIKAKLSLPADRFGVTVLFGPSGSGKTTVLRCVAGLQQPVTGHIALGADQWFDSQQGTCWPPQRRDVGFLAQDYALFPHLTVARNIAYGLGGMARTVQNERTAALVQMLGLLGLEHRYPRQLSGGEQQRVALARAVARRPRLLLLDEPLSALDGPTREQLRRQLHAWLAQLGVPAIVVTHDLAEALTLGETLVVMDQGTMCQTGPADEVVAHPASLAVARIVGMDTMARGTVVSVANGRPTVRIGNTVLLAQTANIQIGEVVVCIRAEDVQLASGPDCAEPTDNKLAGVVRDVARDGHQLRIALDCGFPLSALVSPQIGAKLPLRQGQPLVALVAASKVHLIAV